MDEVQLRKDADAAVALHNLHATGDGEPPIQLRHDVVMQEVRRVLMGEHPCEREIVLVDPDGFPPADEESVRDLLLGVALALECDMATNCAVCPGTDDRDCPFLLKTACAASIVRELIFRAVRQHG